MIDLSSLVKPDASIMVIVAGILEFAKIYIADALEPKVLPLLAVILGAALGYVSMGANGVFVGIISGLTVSGVYKIATNLADKAGGNGK